jgi:hypothetical protein
MLLSPVAVEGDSFSLEAVAVMEAEEEALVVAVTDGGWGAFAVAIGVAISPALNEDIGTPLDDSSSLKESPRRKNQRHCSYPPFHCLIQKNHWQSLLHPYPTFRPDYSEQQCHDR